MEDFSFKHLMVCASLIKYLHHNHYKKNHLDLQKNDLRASLVLGLHIQKDTVRLINTYICFFKGTIPGKTFDLVSFTCLE